MGVKRVEGLPWWFSAKESANNAGATGDVGSSFESGRSPGGGHGNPLQYSLPGESCGQRSLMGYGSTGSQRVRHD